MRGGGWQDAVAGANFALDFMRTNQLDGAVQQVLGSAPPEALQTRPVRLAILGSCTTAQLHPGIRVAALRRNIHVTLFEAEYGQYWQALSEPDPALVEFQPTAILLALDSRHLAGGLHAGMGQADADAALAEILARIRGCWALAQQQFGCTVIHQTHLPVHEKLLGNHEHRLPGSRAAFITRLNAALRPAADEAGVALLALDDAVAEDGIAAWHDPGLWHRAKQEISPAAGPIYGELLGRILAAAQGRAYKCLVLDLDNTLWGGVIGDDGLDGIILGQGSAPGEAYAAFQDYCRELGRRGVILAVCSKNNEATARQAFEKHPEMLLKSGDIACFVANWSDKADNLRAIAEQLNIGLDSLVFADDNPFERSLVRAALPMVAVPELGDDPVHYTRIISDAGYFEAIAITQEDRARAGQYQDNLLREQLRSSATDLPAYLRSLNMQLLWRRFDQIGLSRIVQLINKTNQFNLTTRRYAAEDVQAVMRDARAFGLQLRLLDRFGDNGIIAIVIGRMDAAAPGDLVIDTWLMSCRVLGRQVEAATLNLIAAQARLLGARRLVGEYVPSAKNAMVRDHYEKLGFTGQAGGRAVLDLEGFAEAEIFIDVKEG